MAETKEYYAFISYKREDEKWAKWLANELEHYHLPTTLNGKTLPKNLRPIFRDVNELSAGNLPKQIYQALSISKNLIVVCSPRAAQSEWVNKEISDFIKIKGGKASNIYPFIIEGVPFSNEPDKECFPETLRNLSENEERLGGNINEQGGRKAAVVKIVAGMLDIGFDSLWQKHEREQRKKKKWIFAAVVAAFLCISSVAFWMYKQNTRTQKANWKMMENQSRFISEKAISIANEGNCYLACLFALEVLPNDLNHPDKPYTPEAEAALRYALSHHNGVIRSYNGWVDKVSFNPTGRKILSIDDSVRIWDFSTGKCLNTIKIQNGYPNSGAFNPTSEQIAYSIDSIIVIYDIENNRSIDTLHGHSHHVEDLRYNSTGTLIVSASKDNNARIWDVSTSRCIHTLKGHKWDVYSACFSPDDKYVITSSADKTIRIWNVSDGKCVRMLQNPAELSDAQISPDGKLLASGSWDNTVRIWDFNSGQCILTMKIPYQRDAGVYSVAFSPDGKMVAAAYSDDPFTVRLWEIATGKCVKTFEGHSKGVRTVAFSPDGEYVISGSLDETIRFWKVHEESEGVVLKGFSPQRSWIPCAKSAVFSPNGKQILVPYIEEIIRIWDANTLQCLDSLWEHRLAVNYAQYSPNGKYIASASDDITIRIWNTQKKECIKVLYHDDDVHSVNYSNDGNFIVSASSDSTAILWDSENYYSRSFFRHPSQVKFAVFSPDDKYIATASWDGIVRIWDAWTEKCLFSLEGHTGMVYGVAFSPDGKNLASASIDGSIRIWNTANGSCLQTFEFGPKGCFSAVYSQDGNYLLITYGNEVKVLDAASGTCIQTFTGHTKIVNTAYFSPDNRKIVSASWDNNVIIWDFPPLQELIDQTRERFENRQLTPEERRKYYLE